MKDIIVCEHCLLPVSVQRRCLVTHKEHDSSLDVPSGLANAFPRNTDPSLDVVTSTVDSKTGKGETGIRGRDARRGAVSAAQALLEYKSYEPLLTRLRTGKRQRGEAGGRRSPAVGTSTEIDKAYSRPSDAPDMSKVRPLKVLLAAFRKWTNGAANDSANTATTSFLMQQADALKSIRQDITIQGIRGDFVTRVYVAHARNAIARYDLGELQSCLGEFVGETRDSATGSNNNNNSGAAAVVQTEAGSGSEMPLTNDEREQLGDEIAAYRALVYGLGGRTQGKPDLLAQLLIRLDRDEVDHGVLLSFALRAVAARDNPVVYGALLKSAPTQHLRSLLKIFLPALRVQWLMNVVNGMDAVGLSDLGRMLCASRADVESVINAVPGMVVQEERLMCRQSRPAMERFIAESAASRF